MRVVVSHILVYELHLEAMVSIEGFQLEPGHADWGRG